MRICRCYLKKYPKWKYYNLSLDKQRELILNNLKELTFFSILADDEIAEYIPYEKHIQSTGSDESNRFGEMIDKVWKLKSRYKEKNVKDYSYGTYQGDEKTHNEIITPELWREKNTGRYTETDSRWIKKTRSPDSNTKVKIYWYVDFDGRENLKNLVDDLDVNEFYCSADFAENYSKYDVEPDSLLMESTKGAIFHQTIFKMIWDGKSLGEIKKAVSKDGMTITKPAVKDYRELVGFDIQHYLITHPTSIFQFQFFVDIH